MRYNNKKLRLGVTGKRRGSFVVRKARRQSGIKELHVTGVK